jgi:hypothetical protein
MMRHACQRGLLISQSDPGKSASEKRDLDTDLHDIEEDYRQIWLARNRPGGLDDSIARLTLAHTDYQ